MKTFEEYKEFQDKQKEYLSKLNTELELPKSDKEKIAIYEEILIGVKDLYIATVESSTLVQNEMVNTLEMQGKLIDKIISLSETAPKECKRVLRKLAKERK